MKDMVHERNRAVSDVHQRLRETGCVYARAHEVGMSREREREIEAVERVVQKEPTASISSVSRSTGSCSNTGLPSDSIFWFATVSCHPCSRFGTWRLRKKKETGSFALESCRCTGEDPVHRRIAIYKRVDR